MRDRGREMKVWAAEDGSRRRVEFNGIHAHFALSSVYAGEENGKKNSG